jgi:hypothetical protein
VGAACVLAYAILLRDILLFGGQLFFSSLVYLKIFEILSKHD